MNTIPTNSGVQIGTRVMSADGKLLGTVKDTREDRFLVDVKWLPDYWLGTETIDTTDNDLVQLVITKEAVGAAKLHGVGEVDDSNLPSRM